MKRLLQATAAVWLAVLAIHQSALGEPYGQTKPGGIQLGEEKSYNLQIGVILQAGNRPVRGLIAGMPVPMDWAEQEVTIDNQDVTANVAAVTYRTLGGTARQMLVSVPLLPAGQQAKAIITFKVKRRTILAPRDTGPLKLPPRGDRSVAPFLNPSPYIDSTSPLIARLARETTAGKQGAWQTAEALYDVTREKIDYKNGKIKSAVQALRDGTGDCEELTSLFVALCRASKIPARMVWVDGHCYPEFYLVDPQNQGHWFPCQAAGSRAFGEMPEYRAILHKGDNFKDSYRKEKLRYLSPFVTGKGGRPTAQFIRQQGAG